MEDKPSKPETPERAKPAGTGAKASGAPKPKKPAAKKPVQKSHETRTQAALTEIAAGDGPALVVTSGGLISMAMRQAMALDINGMSRMALAIMNTSMHRLFPIGGHWSPVLFNAVPHLETPDRHYAQTHL